MPNNSRLVYSTDGASVCPRCNKQLRKCHCDEEISAPANNGPLKIEKSTKSRNGKTATVISGLPVNPDQMKPLLKELKKLCGVGGALKANTIEIQGDQQEKVRLYLNKKFS